MTAEDIRVVVTRLKDGSVLTSLLNENFLIETAVRHPEDGWMDAVNDATGKTKH